MAREVEGLRELNRKLKKIGEKAGSRALRSAANFAMTPVLQQARRNAPVGDEPHKTYKGRIVAPGFLSRNIKKKSRIDKRRGTVRAMVGMTPEAYYGSFLEEGTKYIPPEPWLEPAFEQMQSEALDRFRDKLRRAIHKEAAK